MAEFEGCHKCKYIDKESKEHPCNECIRIAIENYKQRRNKQNES